ncbi:MAG: ATP-binding cassette domain-containing protein [Rhodospirillaceae bacterium]|nr:ATP-binding cassette domain-containing protein [Rhodospirillaceae bacterium]
MIDAPVSNALIVGQDLVRHFPLPRPSPFAPRRWIKAVDGVSFRVAPGKSFGVVGESGSGKSTLARLVMALDKPDNGTVETVGQDPFALSDLDLRRHRRNFQMVFQDPFGSLNPRHTVARIVGEPLDGLAIQVGTAERAEKVAEALGEVGLPSDAATRYPHEFSGGQRQRIAIARALITRPKLIVADEPVSALDVSVQAQVLNLMQDLQQKHGVTYFFISHNLAVVEHVCDEVAVMYQGRIVEQAPSEALFADPRHPYTQALMAAIPGLAGGTRRRDRRGIKLAAASTETIPPPPKGCAYAPRCPMAQARCQTENPALREVKPAQRAACHFA